MERLKRVHVLHVARRSGILEVSAGKRLMHIRGLQRLGRNVEHRKIESDGSFDVAQRRSSP